MNVVLNEVYGRVAEPIETLLQKNLDQFELELPRRLELPQEICAAWKLMCELPAEELHANRTRWLRYLDMVVLSSRQMIQIAEQASLMVQRELLHRGELTQLLRYLQEYRTSFEERWQTLEDAEALIWLENNPFDHVGFAEYAKNHRPPQSWFDEDFTGFD